MTVISIEIERSAEEIISGIPKIVTISTNISASIFYTIDGSEPSLSSDIYISPIYMPTDSLSITLKVFATNGVDTSSVISETYFTNLTEGQNSRIFRPSTSSPAGTIVESYFPFGSNSPDPSFTFTSSGNAGVTVDDPNLEQIIDGYGFDGQPNSFTNEPYTTENYNIKYSTTDAIGQTGNGIGSIPARSTLIPEYSPAITTQQFTSTFDPKALVIFQDVSLENPDDPPNINRQYFSLENSETARDGNHFYNSGLDAPPVSGSFLRSHFNPRDNTMTYYYMDTIANKWIISKTPYNPSVSTTNNLSGMVLSKKAGAGFVHEWRPFARRVLF
jgi:hypothetical protein